MKRILLSILTLTVVLLLTACGYQPSPENGANLAVLNGCTACHSSDGTTKLGPTWQGLYNSQVELNDGALVTADEAYLIEAIRSPSSKIVAGYSIGSMPLVELGDEEIADLVAYIKSLE